MQGVFDLVIVGGGINGAGIAADAAGRGLSVLLVERSDLASGTSSASSKLIHGGLRYLEHYDFRLVRPSPGQPGTYGEQLQIVDLVSCDPTHHGDFDGAMRMARRFVLPKTRLVEVTWTTDFPWEVDR